tara:strand:+ start:642 stop:1256 length:615 start_codon:yes stop_codon:yes gene_type:complete
MNEIVGRVPLDGSNWRASPGPVGSVGDTNSIVRLAQSNPEMPMRLAEWTVNNQSLGANISDGYKRGNTSGGRAAETLDSAWINKGVTKRAQGYAFRNVEKPAMSREPTTISLGSYSADNRAANVWEANRTGAAFSPVGAPFALREGDVPRGGLYPRVTDIELGDVPVGEAVMSQRRSINRVGAAPLPLIDSAVTNQIVGPRHTK